jgi:hypothetical protein
MPITLGSYSRCVRTSTYIGIVNLQFTYAAALVSLLVINTKYSHYRYVRFVPGTARHHRRSRVPGSLQYQYQVHYEEGRAGGSRILNPRYLETVPNREGFEVPVLVPGTSQPPGTKIQNDLWEVAGTGRVFSRKSIDARAERASASTKIERCADTYSRLHINIHMLHPGCCCNTYCRS